MPLCRSSLSPTVVPPARGIVRLSRYVVARRGAPRAANDNRPLRASRTWPWAVAIALAPTLTALMLLSGLF
jgi:hypothetical protein